MSLLAVVGKISDDTLKCVEISDDFQNILRGFQVHEQDIVRFVINGSKPLNFSVVDGRIAQDWGSFDRFNDKGSAIVVAEIRSRNGVLLGYRLLSCGSVALVNMKREDVIARCKSQAEPFLQNAIFRKNVVNCYPDKKFGVVSVGTEGQAPQPKKRDMSKKPVKRTAGSPPTMKMSPEQRQEIVNAGRHGINSSFLLNPRLDKDQMRVLWVSKSKGALAEYFSSPDLPPESMKFYADRIYTKKVADDCALMLQHPELTPEQLAELYLCVCDGVDYSDLIGKSPVDIQCERESRSRAYWGKSYIEDDYDYLEKAINVAQKLR